MVGHRSQIALGRYFGSEWRVGRRSVAVEREALITGHVPIVDPSVSALGTPAHKLQFIASTRTKGALDSIREALPRTTAGVFSHASYLEVVRTDVDKGIAIARIARMSAVEPDRIAAIGDGDNDLGLFRIAAIRVAMGNATEALKRGANWVTADNSSDGVASALGRIRRLWFPTTTLRSP
jgi:hydroxymethylpyrimidine pyrophosphatase-like HAD family hydrolase